MFNQYEKGALTQIGIEAEASGQEWRGRQPLCMPACAGITKARPLPSAMSSRLRTK